MKKIIYNILIKPLMTEKNINNQKINKYTYKVNSCANKTLIKQAFQTIYKTNISSINVINIKGKSKNYKNTKGSRFNFKKAIITTCNKTNSFNEGIWL